LSKLQTLAIAGLELNPKVQVRASLDQETIKRYAELKDLPPITIVVIDGDHVVADGWHRVRAAKKRGDEVIRAEVLEGDWKLAYEIACKNNIRHGKVLTMSERNAAMLHLRKDGYSPAQIGKIFGLSDNRVREVAPTGVSAPDAPGQPLGEIRRVTLRKIPDELRDPIEKSAKKRGWSSEEIIAASNMAQDERVPKKMRDAIVSGELDPFVVGSNGEVGVLRDTLQKGLRRAGKEGPRVALSNVQAAMGKLMTYSTAEIVGDVEAHEFVMIREWLERDVDFLSDVLREMRAKKKLEVVR